MATGMISPLYDPQEEKLKKQLAYTEALRKGGAEGDMGGGYQGGRVFIVGEGNLLR